MGTSINCPICDGMTTPFEVTVGIIKIDCENCGKYSATHEAISAAPLRHASESDRAHISGWIRDRWRRGDDNVIIDTEDLVAVLNDVRRLSPAEKTGHLLITLSRIAERPGVEIPGKDIHASDAWAMDSSELSIYVDWLTAHGFLDSDFIRGGSFILTLDGWLEVDRLQRERSVSASLAFMAMPFGDARLDRIVKEYFVPAAQAAGYELRRLDEGQPAGLIDDQLRVRLRTARFVVADLTHNNRGAYWEAGFAEGFGTPVIYTCEKCVFESPERKQGVHFDTNHLVTVLWDESNLPAASDELKAHIRATLPTEARLED